MPWVSCAFSNVLQICPFRHGQNKTGSESLGSFRDQAGWIEVLWKGKESQPGGFGVGVGDLLFPDKPLWSMANMDIGPTLPTIRESPRWKQNSDFVFSFSSSCSLRPCGKRELSCKFSSAALVLQRCPDYLIPRITPSYLYQTKVKSNLMVNLATQNYKNQNPRPYDRVN